MSAIEILTPADYRLTPWKNGAGVTRDVFFHPPGAGHEDFDIRLSLAPITTEGPFSSFPGIDRHITRLSANRLELVFPGAVRALERLVPLYFDSVQAPVSQLPEGPAEVLNVMTRRGRWTAQVMPLAPASEPLLAVPDGGLVILHAVTGRWQVGEGVGEGADTAPAEVAAGSTLVARGGGLLRAAAEKEGEAVVAFLAPATRIVPS